MATLGSLPPELMYPILSYMDIPDWRRLGLTCRSMHAVVAPRLYKAIIIFDTSRSADSGLRAAQRHGSLTRHLLLDVTYDDCFSFDCCITTNDVTRCPYLAANFGHGLPPSAEALLAGDLFPRLQAVTVRFRITDRHANFYYRAPAPMPGRDRAWVFPMMEDVVRAVVKALCRNTRITRLVLLNYPPFDPLELLDTPEEVAGWKSLLGRLLQFSVTFFRHSIDHPIPANSHDAGFLDRTPAAFFDHLGSVRMLAVYHSTCQPLALRPSESSSSPPVHFRRDRMPHLEELRISDVLLGPELTRCLADLATRPLRLIMKRFQATVAEDAPPGCTWKDFFDGLVGRPALIYSFIMDLGAQQLYWTDPAGNLTEDSVAAFRKMALQPGLLVFPYSYHFSYMRFWPDMPSTVAAFLEGEDEDAYRRFHAMVSANCERFYDARRDWSWTLGGKG